MTHLYVWYDSFRFVTWRIHVSRNTAAVGWPLAWLFNESNTTRSYMWCDITHFSCDTTHSHLSHNTTAVGRPVTWLIHTCDITHSHVWHDSFIYVTLHHSRQRACDMTHSAALLNFQFATLRNPSRLPPAPSSCLSRIPTSWLHWLSEFATCISSRTFSVRDSLAFPVRDCINPSDLPARNSIPRAFPSWYQSPRRRVRTIKRALDFHNRAHILWQKCSIFWKIIE